MFMMIVWSRVAYYACKGLLAAEHGLMSCMTYFTFLS